MWRWQQFFCFTEWCMCLEASTASSSVTSWSTPPQAAQPSKLFTHAIRRRLVSSVCGTVLRESVCPGKEAAQDWICSRSLRPAAPDHVGPHAGSCFSTSDLRSDETAAHWQTLWWPCVCVWAWQWEAEVLKDTSLRSCSTCLWELSFYLPFVICHQKIMTFFKCWLLFFFCCCRLHKHRLGQMESAPLNIFKPHLIPERVWALLFLFGC